MLRLSNSRSLIVRAGPREESGRKPVRRHVSRAETPVVVLDDRVDLRAAARQRLSRARVAVGELEALPDAVKVGQTVMGGSLMNCLGASTL
jgi:hypothetical protein